MKSWPALLLLCALAACSVPTPEEAGPPPTGYKDIIRKDIFAHFWDPYSIYDVSISEPQPGRTQFIPGWRVCLRASATNNNGVHTGPVDYGYLFVNGQLQSVKANESACADYTYTAWPEMEGPEHEAQESILHPKWEYHYAYDDLRQAQGSFAYRMSTSFYKLKFPFESKDGTHAYIKIENTTDGLKFFLELDHGQIECKKTGCDINLRFGGASMETVKFFHNDPTNKSEIEAAESAPLIAQLQASPTMLIEVGIPSNGTRQFSFDISGFDMNKLLTAKPRPAFKP